MFNRYSYLVLMCAMALFCAQVRAGVELTDCDAAMKKKTADQVVLESSDGQCATLAENVAKLSETIKNLIEDAGTANVIPLPNINGSILKDVADLMEGILGKVPDQKVDVVKKNLLEYNPARLVQIIKAANYLDIDPPNQYILFVGMDLFSKKIFETDLEKLKIWKAEDYASYRKDVLEALPKDLQRQMIARNLRSIDRVFVSTTKDRRQDAIKQLDLATAQVIAFIDKNKTPSIDKLPEILKRALPNGLPADKILFGPLPAFAIWPANCPLPSNPAYNMYGSDPKPNDRYIDNQDGTITDVCTKLIWEKAPSTPTVAWAAAKSHCANLVKASVKDWRTPNPIELQSIVDYSKRQPALNAVFGDGNGWFWSSSAVVGRPNNAWFVNFGNGHVSYYVVDDNYRVRCVR